MQVNRFTVFASAVATAGALLAIVALPALGAENPYLATAGAGAGLGTLFAGYNLFATYGLGHHRLAPSLMATLFGAFLLSSPSFVDIGDERAGFLGLPEARPAGAASGRIREHLHEGEAIVVQVLRGPDVGKGAKLTRRPALAGRFVVYLPGEAGGAGDRPVASMDGGPPRRAKAAGDLSEHDRGPDLALGGVVGRADAAVLEEDEELAPPGLELGLQRAPGRMGRGIPEQRIELAFEGHRYFDVRRWMIAPDVYENGKGVRITGRLDPNGELLVDNRYDYEYEIINVDQRSFSDEAYFVPIPRSEMQKNPSLVQNPGY